MHQHTRAEPVHFPAKDRPLRHDVGWLGALLGELLRELAPEASELLGAVRSLTMRGGKRFRPALLFAAYRAVKPAGGLGDDTDPERTRQSWLRERDPLALCERVVELDHQVDREGVEAVGAVERDLDPTVVVGDLYRIHAAIPLSSRKGFT